MLKIFGTAVFALALSTSALAAAKEAPVPELCPAPGSKAPIPANLDLKEVMHQFRDHLNEADSIVTRGKLYDPRALPDATLSVTIQHINAARNCALLVVANYDSTMMPPKALEIDPAKMDAFLLAWRQFMQEFADVLYAYGMSVYKQLNTPTPQRNFQDAYRMMLAVRDKELQGHYKF